MVRIALLVTFGMIVATLAALQAASSVLAKREPALALVLMPSNGTAQQALLRSQLAVASAQTGDPEEAAESLEEEAKQAFLDDPLGPSAISIAILAADSPALREARLSASLQVNRRDLVLQGVHLQEAVRAADPSQTFAVINRILRVHPEQQEQMFPVVEQALGRPAAQPALLQLLDGSSDWHSDFLNQAVKDDAHSRALAGLRLAGLKPPEGFDRALLQAVERAGDLELAERLYFAVSVDAAPNNDQNVWNWNTKLPPFDWTLADANGFRAQLSRTGEMLEFAVRSGKAGVVAERTSRRIEPPFSIVAEHQIEPLAQARDVRIELRCAGDQRALLTQRFEMNPQRLDVTELPTDCAFLELQIRARAWSTGSGLSGAIGQIIVER